MIHTICLFVNPAIKSSRPTYFYVSCTHIYLLRPGILSIPHISSSLRTFRLFLVLWKLHVIEHTFYSLTLPVIFRSLFDPIISSYFPLATTYPLIALTHYHLPLLYLYSISSHPGSYSVIIDHYYIPDLTPSLFLSSFILLYIHIHPHLRIIYF